MDRLPGRDEGSRAGFGSKAGQCTGSYAEGSRSFGDYRTCEKPRKVCLALGAENGPVRSVQPRQDHAPEILGRGGVIAPGYNADLDELRAIQHNCGTFLIELEARERERSGIANLKPSE